MIVEKSGQAGIGNAHLLQRIDQLFACGASQYVDIPQIVVIGDQSAGKSSVLSSLIGKDLPRDSSLCTRYPTKLIFRRSSEMTVSIRVIADPGSSDKHQTFIKSINKWDLHSWDDLNLEDVMKDVNSKIGITPDDDSSSEGTRFSNDILQIEISGPDQDHYSVIDIPGIFRDPEPGKSTMNDMVFVRSMVESYMKSPRSVMLAVIPANCDVATQEILQMAQRVDPDGDRTLGVLTKPDLVDPGAEDRVIDLLRGRSRPLKLGWHVVRNAGQKVLMDKTLDKRALEVEFFTNNSPWNILKSDDWGAHALVVKLREVLGSLVKRTFSHVKRDVKEMLAIEHQALKKLGPERNTRPAQAAFLIDLSTDFQGLVRNALSARTGNSEVFSANPNLKIAPVIVARMENFARTMARWGHAHHLRSSTENESEHEDVDSDETVSDSNDTISILTRQEENILEIEDILDPQSELPKRETAKENAWLQDLYLNNRGFEIGTFDPAILSSAMREQTQNWPCLCRGYTSDIIVIIHKFIQTALETICKDDRLQNNLYNHIEARIRERYDRAKEQVNFILAVELNGQPLTHNQYFNENLQSNRHTRMSDLLSELNIKHQQYGRDLHSPPISNRQYIVQDIGDILSAYYHVARKRFVDNICKQATDYFLVNGPNTPLTVFSPNLVSQMSDKELQEIAGEEERVKRQREQINKDIINLEKIINILSN